MVGRSGRLAMSGAELFVLPGPGAFPVCVGLKTKGVADRRFCGDLPFDSLRVNQKQIGSAYPSTNNRATLWGGARAENVLWIHFLFMYLA